MPQQICFPNHEGQPGQSDPPDVDGYVEPEPAMVWAFGDEADKVDVGWTGAGRQTYGEAVDVDIATPLVVLQGVRHRTQDKLYLSFIVRRDVTFDRQDRIVLVFHPDFATGSVNKTGAERRIDIFPVHTEHGAGLDPPNEDDPWDFTDGGQGFKTNRPPRGTEVYRWSMSEGKWEELPLGTPSGLVVKVRSWYVGDNNSNWSVEVEVPTTIAAGGSNWIDLSESIGFFADVIRVAEGKDDRLSFVTQFVWPHGSDLDDNGGALEVHQIPIEPAKLGQAFVGSSSLCTGIRGVRFESTWGSVGARAPGSGADPGSSILPTQNEFVARVVNDGPDPAPGVTADFRIANWGIGPGDAPLWNRLVPDSGHENPTVGKDFGSGSVASPIVKDLTTRWTPPAGQYGPGKPFHPHQCIWVLLDSPGTVSFVRASAKRNMNVVPLSEHDEEAQIDGRGWAGDDEPGDELDFILLESHLSVARRHQIIVEGERERPERRTHARVRFEPGLVGDIDSPKEPIDTPKDEETGIWYEQIFVTIVDGYRRTGKTLTMDGRRLPIYSYTDSFGQIGVHGTAKLDDLEVGLEGPSVTPLDPGSYAVKVPRDGVVRFNVRMRTVDRSDRPGPSLPHPETNWFWRLILLLLEILKRMFRSQDRDERKEE